MQQFPFRSEKPGQRVRLVCLPFASGGAGAYRSWTADVPAWVELCAYEPPGRGVRLGGALVETMDAFVDDLLDALSSLPVLPTAFFGHSLGGRVAWSAAQRMKTPPLHLFAAAARPPNLEAPKRARLPRAEFLRELVQLGGTPKEVLADDELLDLFLPIVRADFAVLESPVPERKVDIPTTVFSASSDPEIRPEQLRMWGDCSGPCTYVDLVAEHFFLTTHKAKVLEHVWPVIGACSRRAH